VSRPPLPLVEHFFLDLQHIVEKYTKRRTTVSNGGTLTEIRVDTVIGLS